MKLLIIKIRTRTAGLLPAYETALGLFFATRSIFSHVWPKI